jgi:predicted DNA-binding WGR domain protein
MHGSYQELATAGYAKGDSPICPDVSLTALTDILDMSDPIYNVLKINGPAEEVERFIRENEGPNPDANGSYEPLVMNNLVPRPSKTKGDWEGEHWGTNYLIFDPGVNWYRGPEAGSMHLAFESNYVPPIEWLKTAVQTYPTLNFELRAMATGGEPYLYTGWGKDGQYEETGSGYEDEPLASFLQNALEVLEQESEENLVLADIRTKHAMLQDPRYRLWVEHMLEAGDSWPEVDAPSGPRIVKMTQIDEGKNVKKFYNIVAYSEEKVYAFWGRIGTRGRLTVLDPETQPLERVIQAKLRGGYEMVSDTGEFGLGLVGPHRWQNMPYATVDPLSEMSRFGGYPFASAIGLHPHIEGEDAILFVAQVKLPDGRLARFYADPDALENGDFGNYEDSFEAMASEDPYYQAVLPEDTESMFDWLLIEGEPLPPHLQLVEIKREDVPVWSEQAFAAPVWPTHPHWVAYADVPADATDFLFQVPLAKPRADGYVDWSEGAVYFFWNEHSHTRVLWQLVLSLTMGLPELPDGKTALLKPVPSLLSEEELAPFDEEARMWIKADVLTGFRSMEYSIEHAFEAMTDDTDGGNLILEAYGEDEDAARAFMYQRIQKLAEEAWQAQLLAQAGQGPTVYDRLRAAFDELSKRHKLYCAMYYSFDVRDFVFGTKEAAGRHGSKAIVGFHQQTLDNIAEDAAEDADRTVLDSGPYLLYRPLGSMSEQKLLKLVIGALEKHQVPHSLGRDGMLWLAEWSKRLEPPFYGDRRELP